MTTEPRFAEGDLVAAFKSNGLKLSKPITQIDKLLPPLSDADLRQLLRWMDLMPFADADPERRRELLSERDVCPCCDRWLGHNRPPRVDDE
jgi:hypothetical protein